MIIGKDCRIIKRRSNTRLYSLLLLLAAALPACTDTGLESRARPIGSRTTQKAIILSQAPPGEITEEQLASSVRSMFDPSASLQKSDSDRKRAEVTFEDQRLSIDLNARSMSWVLGEISKQSGIPIAVQEAGMERMITARFQSQVLERGLRLILENEDTIFLYGPEGLKTVLVYPKGRGEEILAHISAQMTDSMQGLVLKLESSDENERANAIEKLVERMGQEAEMTILDKLQDQSDAVRERTLQATLQAQVELPFDKVAELAELDPSAIVRLYALEAVVNHLGDRHHQQRVATLRDLVNDSDPMVRRQAKQILKQLDGPPPVPEEPAPPDKEHSQAAVDGYLSEGGQPTF